MPRVSIIVLSHRTDAEGLSMLSEAIASVAGQTHRDCELIVKSHPTWYREKINEAIRASSGEWFGVLCYDDLLAPTWAASCLAAAMDARADFAYSDLRIVSPFVPPITLALPDYSRTVVTRACVPYVTALTSRELFERTGGYDGRQIHFDWDFWATCAEHDARAAHVRDPLCWTRVHTANGSRGVGDEHLAMLKAKHPWLMPELKAA